MGLVGWWGGGTWTDPGKIPLALPKRQGPNAGPEQQVTRGGFLGTPPLPTPPPNPSPFSAAHPATMAMSLDDATSRALAAPTVTNPMAMHAGGGGSAGSAGPGGPYPVSDGLQGGAGPIPMPAPTPVVPGVSGSHWGVVPQPAQLPPPVPAPGTPSPALADLLRFTDAVGACATRASDFRQMWATVSAPATPAEVRDSIARMRALKSADILRVLQGADDAARQYFHAKAAMVASQAREDVDDLASSAATVKWLARTGLPAVKSLPEDEQMGTTTDVAGAMNKLLMLAEMVRPDGENPAVNAAREDATRTRATADNAVAALTAKLTAAGVDPAGDGTTGPGPTALAQSQTDAQKATTIAWVMGGVAVALFIAAVALGVVLYTRSKPGKGSAAQSTTQNGTAPTDSGPGAGYLPAAGGRARLAVADTMGGGDFNAEGEWTFPAVMPPLWARNTLGRE